MLRSILSFNLILLAFVLFFRAFVLCLFFVPLHRCAVGFMLFAFFLKSVMLFVLCYLPLLQFNLREDEFLLFNLILSAFIFFVLLLLVCFCFFHSCAVSFMLLAFISNLIYVIVLSCCLILSSWPLFLVLFLFFFIVSVR